jgi:hypothetical protein
MEFRTVLKPEKSPFEIGYDTPILAIGSCFAENIGERLRALRLPTLLNPTGIVFNPISVSESLKILLGNYTFSEKDIFFDGNLWHSFKLHGRFSSPEKTQLLRGGQNAILQGHEFLKTAKCLIVTLGTAWVFEEKKTRQIVANCHKIAATQFERKRLSVDMCASCLINIFERILQFNPTLNIVVSVSPVRHLKDGFVENQRSKSTLILALDILNQHFKHLGNFFYFPAYELLLDDLRDYRFFAQDMVHPSEQAIQYTFDFFKKTFFTERTILLAKQVEQINAALTHRPLHPDTLAYEQFRQQIALKINILTQKFRQLGLKIEFDN